MRSLVDLHKDELIVIIGKRYPQLKAAAKGYGFHNVVTSEEYVSIYNIYIYTFNIYIHIFI